MALVAAVDAEVTVVSVSHTADCTAVKCCDVLLLKIRRMLQ